MIAFSDKTQEKTTSYKSSPPVPQKLEELKAFADATATESTAFTKQHETAEEETRISTTTTSSTISFLLTHEF